MVMRNYHDVNYFMRLDIKTGTAMIRQVYKKDIEEKLWQQWNLEHIFMDGNNFVTYQDYIKKAFEVNPKKSKMTAREIISMAENIKRDFKEKGYEVEKIEGR